MSTLAAAFSSRRVNRWLPWVSALILAIGLGTFLVRDVFSSGGSSTAAPATPVAKPAVHAKGSGGFDSGLPSSSALKKTLPVPAAARDVAGRFILTAVARKNLAESWKLAAPELRQGITYKQWLTGNIPVVPYLAPIASAPLAVRVSTARYILLETSLLPKTGNVKPQDFYLELRKLGKGAKAHWAVVSWVPHASAPIPVNPASS